MAQHNDLGQWGEALVAQRLAAIAPVEPAQRADLRWYGVEIEVKTSLPHPEPHRRARFQFCISRDGHSRLKGDVVVLVTAPDGICYIIPARVVAGVKRVAVGPRGGKLEQFKERWEIIADVLEEACLSKT